MKENQNENREPGALWANRLFIRECARQSMGI